MAATPPQIIREWHDKAKVPPAPEKSFAPGWVKDAVFYQVFPERFANGDAGNDPFGTQPWGTKPTNDAFMGGDLVGLKQKLPYLKDLGVNALYLNPIFESPSNHKYDTVDYDNVDENFGGNAAFRDLMKEARKHDVRVVLDGVLNHTSQQHDWFRDVREKGPKSEHWDKYEVHHWPIRYWRDDKGVLRSGPGPQAQPDPTKGQDYASWWGYSTLPELRDASKAVRDEFLHKPDSVVKKWIRDYGIDGWRMDVADEVPVPFWQEARKEIKSANPDAYLVAEAWKDASPYLQGDTFDSVMNYKYFQQPAIEFFAKKQLSSDEFVRNLGNEYPVEAKHAMFNLLGSHDTARYANEAGGDWFRARPAAIFQMTYVGAPVVYYGDELGLPGGGDPDSRRTFPWNEKERGEGADQLHSLYRKMIHLRNQEPVLRAGGFEVLGTHNDNRTLSYRRYLPDSDRDAIVAINNDVTGHQVTVPVNGAAPDGTPYRDALSGKRFTVKDGKLILPHVEGNYGAVLLRDEQKAERKTARK